MKKHHEKTSLGGFLTIILGTAITGGLFYAFAKYNLEIAVILGLMLIVFAISKKRAESTTTDGIFLFGMHIANSPIWLGIASIGSLIQINFHDSPVEVLLRVWPTCFLFGFGGVLMILLKEVDLSYRSSYPHIHKGGTAVAWGIGWMLGFWVVLPILMVPEILTGVLQWIILRLILMGILH